MFAGTMFMALLVIVLMATAYFRGGTASVSEGVKSSFFMTIEIIPMIILAFLAAGFVKMLLPDEVLSKWIGAESGLKGIFIGTAAGMLSPGGPFVSFPLVAGFLGAGAGMGPAVAYITSWSLLSLSRLPLEVGILGWKFVFIRMACTFFFPIMAGLLAQFLFK